MARPTWVTWMVWVILVTKWSPSGLRKTWVLCLSRRKDLGMDHPVPVPLECGAELVGLLRLVATLALVCLGGRRGEQFVLESLPLLTGAAQHLRHGRR